MGVVVIRSLVYAGLISSILAINVCILFGEYNLAGGKIFNLGLWFFVYRVHKIRGTW